MVCHQIWEIGDRIWLLTFKTSPRLRTDDVKNVIIIIIIIIKYLNVVSLLSSQYVLLRIMLKKNNPHNNHNNLTSSSSHDINNRSYKCSNVSVPLNIVNISKWKSTF